MSDDSLISVVIPHLNQEEALGRCLESLYSQQNVRSKFQIIIADNGSPTLPSYPPNASIDVALIQEKTPGPGPARNAGVAKSKGQLLAFIDADCTAHPLWLHTIEKAFQKHERTVIGGEVLVAYVDPKRPSFLEPYEAIYSYRNNEHVASGFSGTGNLAMRREIFDIVGPFAGISVAEDRDWGFRAQAKGIVTEFVPNMIVYHPARKKFTELKTKWDRHIAHDFKELDGLKGRVFWGIKTCIMTVSPLIEIGTIIRSPKVNGVSERWLAFQCLVCIRFYRAWRMVCIVFARNTEKSAQHWNRGE